MMHIYISAAVGSGPTELSAFDAALLKIGIANFNLIRLSSVIPPQSSIVLSDTLLRPGVIAGQWGDKLYAVYAERREGRPGKDAWAGIGWLLDESSGKGLFVEHDGSSESEVRTLIKLSLDSLQKNRNIKKSITGMKVIGKTCQDNPACALAVAVYQTEGWRPVTENSEG